MPNVTLLFVCLCCLVLFAGASGRADGSQLPPIPIWPNGAPGSEGKTGDEAVRVTDQGDHVVTNIHHPSITPYLPDKQKPPTAAVIVIPGGGHRELWMDHEGYRVAQWLIDHKIAAFIVKYRLSGEPGSTYTVEGDELPDVQHAIRTVRSRAAEWNVDPNRIGVIGFSAGGNLAALAGTRYDAGKPDDADPVNRESSKPAFMGLIYPGIPKEMNITKETPPTFLLCGANDRTDISEGVPDLFLKLKRAGVSAEVHVFAGVGHGFGIRDTNKPPVSDWPTMFYEWLEAGGFLAGK